MSGIIQNAADNPEMKPCWHSLILRKVAAHCTDEETEAQTGNDFSSSCISGEKVQLPLCCHRSVCKDFEQCLTLQSVTNSSAIRQVFFRVSNVTHTLQCMLMWLPSSLKGSLGDVACLGAAAMSLILNSFQEWRKDSKCKRWSFGWEDHR